jgi:hypothetical protein
LNFRQEKQITEDFKLYRVPEELTELIKILVGIGHHNPKANTSASSQETFWQRVFLYTTVVSTDGR